MTDLKMKELASLAASIQGKGSPDDIFVEKEHWLNNTDYDGNVFMGNVEDLANRDYFRDIVANQIIQKTLTNAGSDHPSIKRLNGIYDACVAEADNMKLSNMERMMFVEPLFMSMMLSDRAGIKSRLKEDSIENYEVTLAGILDKVSYDMYAPMLTHERNLSVTYDKTSPMLEYLSLANNGVPRETVAMFLPTENETMASMKKASDLYTFTGPYQTLRQHYVSNDKEYYRLRSTVNNLKDLTNRMGSCNTCVGELLTIDLMKVPSEHLSALNDVSYISKHAWMEGIKANPASIMMNENSSQKMQNLAMTVPTNLVYITNATYDTEFDAVKEDWRMLRLAKKQDHAMCSMAISANRDAFSFVNEKDEGIARVAAFWHPELVDEMEPELRTESVIGIARNRSIITDVLMGNVQRKDVSIIDGSLTIVKPDDISNDTEIDTDVEISL